MIFMLAGLCLFFFFKQKTAYEMRISDWSSDVCSSDLVVDICGCETLWTAAHIIDDQVARVREQVGSDEVILGLSGGVDSSVVAALLHRAIGDQLTCVF